MDNTNTNTEIKQDPIVAQLQKALTEGANKVSSETSGVQDAISGAIKQVKTGQEATASRINSSFNRETTYGIEQGQRNVDAYAEARSGFATQMAGLRNLTGQTDKYLADLASRKEEALAANDAASAASIAGLMVEGQKMKMDALQNAFSNLLQVSSFGLNARQFELGQAESSRQFNLNYDLAGKTYQLNKDSQSFQEREAIGGIAAEFGLEVDATDTIDSIVSKAAGTGAVSQRRALEMESLRAQISNSNAQAAKALKEMEAPKVYDPVMVEVFASEIRAGRATYSDLADTPEKYSQLAQAVQGKDKLQQSSIDKLRTLATSEQEFSKFLEQLKSGTNEADKGRIESYAANAIANVPLSKEEVKKKEKQVNDALGAYHSQFTKGNKIY